MSLLKWCIFLTLLGVVYTQEKRFNFTDFDFAKVLVGNISQIAANANGDTLIINEYVDRFLVELNNYLVSKDYDPTPLPDENFEFEYKILLIRYKGEMSLKNGWLQGLSTVKRSDDATVTYKHPNINIRVLLGFDKLEFTYDYSAKFMGIGPTGGIDGRIQNFRCIIKLGLDTSTSNLTLQELKIQTLGKMSVKFNGSVLTDWLVNIFVTVTIPFVQPVLRLVIQIFILDVTQAVIDGYNDFYP